MTPSDPTLAFPRRRVRTRASARDLLVIAGSAAMALALLAFAVWMVAQYGPGLLRDSASWREGERVQVLGLDQGCTVKISWLPLARCDARARYLGSDGAPHTQTLRALTFFGIDPSRPAELRVDAARGGRAVLSWYVDELPLRWLAEAVLVGALLLLAGVVGRGAAALVREFRLYRALAAAPRPALAQIVAERLVSSPGWAREIVFSYRTLAGVEATATQRLRVLRGAHGVAPTDWTYEAPIALASSPRSVLALVGARGARLVKQSFAPLVLSAEEQQRVREAAARA